MKEKIKKLKECSARKYPDAGDLQDFTQKPIMVGGDVVGLYPNMDIVATAELSARALVESDIHVKGVDYKYLAVYLFLVPGPVTMVNLGLGHCVPYRLIKSSANSLAASSNRELNNWKLDVDTPRDSDKQLLLAQMLKIGNLVAMETTCYSFGGHIFRQRGGAGIGLRSSACLAKVTISICDVDWSRIQTMWSFKSMLYVRYIDDCRVLLRGIKRGWIWEGGKVSFF